MRLGNAEFRSNKPLGFGLHSHSGSFFLGISVLGRHIGTDLKFTKLTEAAIEEEKTDLTGTK